MVRPKEKNLYQPVTPNKRPRAPSWCRLKQEGGKAQANVAALDFVACQSIAALDFVACQSIAALDFVACQSKKAANIHNRW